MAFQLRPMTPADYPRIVEILTAQVPTPPTLEELLLEDKAWPPEGFRHRLSAVNEEGLLVGSGQVLRYPTMRPGEYQISVRVDQAWRRQGVGAMLFRELEQVALAQKPSSLVCGVREGNPADLAWAEARGFAIEHHLFESTLDLDTFDPTPFAEAVIRAEAGGIRFTSFADLELTDENLRQYNDLSHEVVQDMPGGEGHQKMSLEELKRQLKLLQEAGEWDPADNLLAFDGDRWIGLASIGQRKSTGAYYHNFTAVRREYRGRGIAMALKLKVIEQARRNGAPYLLTNNHSVNGPMLAINEKLGYRPKPGIFQLKRKVTE